MRDIDSSRTGSGRGGGGVGNGANRSVESECWFRIYRRGRRPQLRLFCFPYAGGSAAVFDGWERALPADVDVFAIQAPGRADRFAEAPIADLREKVARLREAIVPFVDVPYVFIGHSNGALTAFELARTLQIAGSGQLRHLVMSAKRAPHLPRISPLLHALPYDELIEELRSLSATPPAMLANRELMDLCMPMLRADFALAEVGTIAREPRLRTRCTLFRGRRDERIPKDDMLAWREYIDGPVALAEFDGDHFFIDSQRHDVLRTMRDILIDELSMARSTSASAPGSARPGVPTS
jgi:medium-chain acyl-[acyl-carrier-protein] hydrolase